MSDTDLQVINTTTPAQFRENHNQLIEFVKSQLKESKDIAGGQSGDYGVIPYTKKKSLLKPGAEKLLKLFGLSAKLELVSSTEDFANKFVSYKYKCTITHIASGSFIADATRSCNNKEKKHATKDVYDVANTIEAVAQKRALVAATVQATMATEIFDADVSEHETEGPGETVKREDDPRRARVMMKLQVVASEHGWNDKWLHTAIEKKWGFKSLTECSNQQLEELRDFIEASYEEVPEGTKPIKIGEKVAESGGNDTEDTILVTAKREIKAGEAVTTDDVELPVEGEVVETTTKYFCKGPRHEGKDPVEVGEVGGWCSDQCRIDYYGPDKAGPKQRDWSTFGKKKTLV